MDETPDPPVTVPRRAYLQLRSAFVAQSVDQVTRGLLRDGTQPPRFAHPGDPFGTVLAWMWRSDPGQAMFFLADVMAGLRDHNPVAYIDPPVTLEELLSWMRLALPHDVTDQDYDEMAAMARREVPVYYGRKPS